MSTNPTEAQLQEQFQEYRRNLLIQTPHKYISKEEAKEISRLRAKEKYKKNREVINAYRRQKYEEEKRILAEAKQKELAASITNSNNSLNTGLPQTPFTFVAQPSNGIASQPNVNYSYAQLPSGIVSLSNGIAQPLNGFVQQNGIVPQPNGIVPQANTYLPQCSCAMHHQNIISPQMHTNQPFAVSNAPLGPNGVLGQQNAIQPQMYPNQPFTNQTFGSTVSYVPSNNVPNS